MRLRTQLLLLVAAVALSPILVSAIYAGASAVLRQPTDVAQRDFPLAMRAIKDDLPRVLAGEQDSIDLPDGVVLTVLDTENLVVFSTAAEYGRGAPWIRASCCAPPARTVTSAPCWNRFSTTASWPARSC